MIVALDSEALSALAGPNSPANRRVLRALATAVRLRRKVVVPAVVLAELYRGPGHAQRIDAFLARRAPAIAVRDTDRRLARFVGEALHAAKAGSEHMVDAHVVAVAVEAGGGLILTGDLEDLTDLAAPYRSIIVEPITN
ncbi:MAG: PIN domain-containing protein [Egibacteraceae bacterium]